MTSPETSPLQKLWSWRLLLPIVFCFAVAGFMLYREFDYEKIKSISFQSGAWLWLMFCVFFMMLRDAAYIWRMKLLATGDLNWRQAFDVTLLWEFSNTVTPSIMGGTPLMIYLLVKEGMNTGKSAAVIFLTIFLDQMYYVGIVPLMLLIVGHAQMMDMLSGALGTGITVAFWFAYSLLFTYVVLLSIGLLINPNLVKRLLQWLFSTRLLRRWEAAGNKVSEDLLNASEMYKGMGAAYWWKMGLSTVFAWGSRFLVLNCLLSAFSPTLLSYHEHLLAFGRQAVLFVVMIVSITPGASGIAEISFLELFKDISPNPPGAGIIAFLWRAVGFYPYLLLGLWLVPRWMLRVFGKKEA